LQGVRVLDLSRLQPGAYCTLLLADLGAGVLKVEQPGAGDLIRGQFGTDGPDFGHVGLNRGKRSMTLDTRHARAPEVLRRLVRDADVLVESGRPGQLGELGFGYEAASTENPALIWCALTGFGQDSPYASRPGHDLTYMAQSGLLAAMADMPWMPDIPMAIPLGGLMGVVGILAALEGRRTSGQGCLVDISLSEAGSWILSGFASLLAGKEFKIPYTADRRLYRCGDGRYVSVAAAEPRTWRLLCEGLGVADLADALHAPVDRQPAISERLEAIFATRPAHEWVEQLGGAGAAVGAVNRGQDLVTDPHVVARHAVVEVGGTPVPGNPIRYRGRDGSVSGTNTQAPPALGADTDDALTEAGFRADEIADLREQGTI
jgi:alpha-methylacyl-CoA racemase